MHGPKVIVDMLAERGQTTLGRHQCIRVLSSWFSCHCAHWPCWWFFQVGCCAHAWRRHCGVLALTRCNNDLKHKRDTCSRRGIYKGPSLQQDVLASLQLQACNTFQYLTQLPSAEFYLTQSKIPHTFGRDHFDVLYVRISYEYSMFYRSFQYEFY